MHGVKDEHHGQKKADVRSPGGGVEVAPSQADSGGATAELGGERGREVKRETGMRLGRIL